MGLGETTVNWIKQLNSKLTQALKNNTWAGKHLKDSPSTMGKAVLEMFGRENLNALETFLNIWGAGNLLNETLSSIWPETFPKASDLAAKINNMVKGSKRNQVQAKLSNLSNAIAKLPIPLSQNMKYAIQKVEKDMVDDYNQAQKLSNLGDDMVQVANQTANAVDYQLAGNRIQGANQVEDLTSKASDSYKAADEILSKYESNV